MLLSRNRRARSGRGVSAACAPIGRENAEWRQALALPGLQSKRLSEQAPGACR